MRPVIELNGYHCYQPSAWISAVGEDTHEFLQSQLSNDLNPLESGRAVYGLWLDQKGKVHGDSFVYRVGEEEFRLMSYATPEKEILDKLNRFIVADDVELEGQTADTAGLSLIGDAVCLVDELGFSGDHSGQVTIEGEIIYSFPGRRGAQSSLELISSKSGQEVLLAQLLEMSPVLESLDTWSMDLLRILNVCPSIPQDIGPNELPQEGGLETDAVSFTKGCYLGQEVMSRLHSMGRVRRSLRLIQASQIMETGTELLSDGKKAGVIKSVVQRGEDTYGLALLSNAVADGPIFLALVPDGEFSVSLVSL